MNLNIKIIEMWINDTILEADEGEKYDRTIHKVALKKYGIDRKNLKSKGIIIVY